MNKFKINDIVIFKNDFISELNNSKGIIVNTFGRNAYGYSYLVRFENNEHFTAYESDISLLKEKKNHLPKWW